MKFMKMEKCLPEFEYFYCILEKKRNFISKIRISKVSVQQGGGGCYIGQGFGFKRDQDINCLTP